jgi:AAA domain-containing protein
MRDLSLDRPAEALPFDTYLMYGNTRSGKTHFAATFPRPFVIADVAEGGWQTVRAMNRNLWFEPDIEPMIKGIDQMNDVIQMSPMIDQLIATGRIRTIVFDALSFYTDFMLAQMTNVMAGSGKPVDNRQLYGQLGVHLRELRQTMHLKGVNVVWLCLAKHPDEDDPKGGPMIPGKQGDKFAAGVDYLWYFKNDVKRQNGKIVEETYNIYTRQFGVYIAGHRLGVNADLLPDIFTGTYADLMAFRGYDPDQLRKIIAQPIKKSGPVGAPVVNRSPAKPAGNNQAPRGAANK